MMAVWQAVPQPSGLYSAMWQYLDYRTCPYGELKSCPVRAEPIFILLAARELAKASTNDISADTLADRADTLMQATYKQME